MKRKHLVLIILGVVLISIFVVDMVYYNNVSGEPVTTVLGSNDNGTVYKTICGNQSSEDTVVLILGVHNLENGTHNATMENVINLTKNNELTKKFVVYSIEINWDAEGLNTSDYDVNRHMGELLAYKYIVNDVKQHNPFVVVDVHEMDIGSNPDRYVSVISTNQSTAYKYDKQLSNATQLKELVFTGGGTSPPWITIPLSNQGFNTLLFEYAQGESYTNKLNITYKLVKCLDSLNPI